MKLFGRKWRVVAGVFETTDLHVSGKVTRTLKPEPNKAELSIWGLSKQQQGVLGMFGSQIPISIEAGYEEGTSVLFVGELREMRVSREGPEVITHLGAGDGETAYRTKRVNVSIAKGAKVDDILKKIVAALGVAPGNVSSAVVKIKLAGLGTLFSQGTVLQGSASREMTHVCRSCGLQWSIQNGALQILPIGKALEGTAVYLDQFTGLVGAPSLDSKGVMRGACAMIPDVIPGRIVEISSEFLSGNFRLETTEASFDSHGDDWGISFEGKRF